MDILPLLVQILPSVSASRHSASVMGCVGTSHKGVARRAAPCADVISKLALLARPCVVSLTVKRAMIVLISIPTLRAVSYFALAVPIAMLRTGNIGGGCTVASPFGNNVADGKNCKSIPDVDQVLCNGGTCKILSCKQGFKVSSFGDACVKLRIDRVRQVRGVGVVDEVLNLLVHEHLLVDALDIVGIKQRLLSDVKILDYDHILQALLLEGAIVGVSNLLELKERLGLDSAIRRGIPAVDDVLGLLLKYNLIVGFHDILAIKEFLGAKLEVLNVDSLLELLLGQHLIVGITSILALKEVLGLDVNAL